MNRILLMAFGLSLLSSCSLAPDYRTPNVETPSEWSGRAVTEDAESSKALAIGWWQDFASSELNALMKAALEYNLDLKASEQRIRQARASVQIARSRLFPLIGASGNISRDRTIRGSRSSTDGDTSLNGGLDISYELDLFGANRSQADAAEAVLLGSRFQYDALALIVMGDVASTYFNLLSARERLAISNQNLKNAQEILRIVEAQYDAGAASGLEKAQQKSSLGSFEAAQASIEREIENFENALAILLGKPPQSLDIETPDLSKLKIPDIALGQPADLLTRRPDIASVEADLLAANADIGAARAAFFPSVTLGVGLSALAAPISSSATAGLSAASAITVPIFQGGALTGNLRLTEARKAELVENYRKTVLVSFQEVEDALAAEKAAALRETAFKTAVEQAQKAYDISMVRYKAGSIAFQTVIDSQSILLQAQQNHAFSRNERLSASVDLFKALGGGWQTKKTGENDSP